MKKRTDAQQETAPPLHERKRSAGIGDHDATQPKAEDRSRMNCIGASARRASAPACLATRSLFERQRVRVLEIHEPLQRFEMGYAMMAGHHACAQQPNGKTRCPSICSSVLHRSRSRRETRFECGSGGDREDRAGMTSKTGSDGVFKKRGPLARIAARAVR
jgi:hypothetical protein